jgi:uncharacterized protein
MNHLHIHRLFLDPNQSYFLFGPRGTGKSTMVFGRHPDATVINLLLSSTRQRYLARPEMLLNVVRATVPGSTIIIDEIQKAPELLSIVHMLIEEKQNWKVTIQHSSVSAIFWQS